jgi:hypothetical protein
MSTRKVSVSVGATINLGNFESMRLDCTVEEFVAGNENATNALHRAWKQAYAFIEEKVEEEKK